MATAKVRASAVERAAWLKPKGHRRRSKAGRPPAARAEPVREQSVCAEPGAARGAGSAPVPDPGCAERRPRRREAERSGAQSRGDAQPAPGYLPRAAAAAFLPWLIADKTGRP